jgi:hypothetical protein
MRHSDIKLTIGVYTDPRLLDVRGAVEKLPTLTLSGEVPDGTKARMTGTEGGSGSLAPVLAPTRCNREQFGSSGGTN